MTEHLPATTDTTPTLRAPSADNLRAALARIDADRAALVEAGDLERLAAGLVAIDPIVGDLRTRRDTIKADAAQLLRDRGDQRVIIPGAVVERDRTQARWSTDSPAVLRDLLAIAAQNARDTFDDSVADEIIGVTIGAVLDVLTQTLPLTRTGINWRMGGDSARAKYAGLRGYLDPETIAEHRTKTSPARDTVNIITSDS